MRIASLGDLRGDDKELFLKDHNGDCPGVASLNFYGDGKAAVAVELLADRPRRAKLIVASTVGDKWDLRDVDSTDGPPPALWTDKPGEYVDVQTGKGLQSVRPVLVWCQYAAWAIVYAWTGSPTDKVWIAD